MDVHHNMGNTVLGTTAKEEDVTVGVDMNVSEQCCIATSNGKQIIGLIRRNITHIENSKLYLSINE